MAGGRLAILPAIGSPAGVVTRYRPAPGRRVRLWMMFTRRCRPPCVYCSESSAAFESMDWVICSSMRRLMFQPTLLSAIPAPIAEIAKYASDSLKTVVRNSLTRAIADHIPGPAYRVEERGAETF